MSERELPVPDLMIERLALGDLDSETAAEVRAKLEASGSARRLEALAASNREILSRHPAADVLAEARRRLEREGRAPERPRVTVWSGWLLGAGAAAAILLLIVRTPGPSSPAEQAPLARGSEAGEVIRTKGLRPHLVVYKKTPDGPARLGEAGRARPGDTLQVAYVAAGRRYGMVASQDARGTITFHLPTKGTEAVALNDGREIPVANAFELDDSPGYERFVFVTSDQPFGASAVVDLLTKRQPKLSPAMSVMDVVVTKEVR